MTFLLTADLHQTDRPRDVYRFGIYTWLAKQQLKHNVQATFILGDITDAKDRHPSVLVNQVVRGLKLLRPPIYVLKGNHDYTDPNNPFFGFLSHIDGIEFVSEPIHFAKLNIGMVPHCRTQAELDTACGVIIPKPDLLLLHVTIEGAKAETGGRLSGLRASPIELLHPKATYSGDVHRPQRCGAVTYVGSPYHCRFGDDFTPRVLLLQNGVERNLYFHCPHKWTLKINDHSELLKMEELRPGDQVKIEYQLAREEAVEWAKHKQLALSVCKELGLEVYGVDLKINTGRRRERIRVNDGSQVRSHEEVFTSFCNAEAVSSHIKKAGTSILRGRFV